MRKYERQMSGRYGRMRVQPKNATRLFPSTGHKWTKALRDNMLGVSQIVSYDKKAKGEDTPPTNWLAMTPDLFSDRFSTAQMVEFLQSKLGRIMCGVPLRSKMEANIARYFEALRIGKIVRVGAVLTNWIHEPCRFEFPTTRGVRDYMPDFLVIYASPRSFEFIEVKGYMDKKDKRRLDLFAEHFPELQNHMRVIDDASYRAIGAKLRHVIPGWEQ